jgi:carbonic anhydrase
MAHNCKAILFHCIDFRLIKETTRWMKANNLVGDCDIVSVAGSSKSIVDGSEQLRDFLLGQINTSCTLHNCQQVILLHHSDCGAYRNSYNFSSPAEEKAKQEEDMEKAKNIIKDKFSEINILKVWAQMKDSDGKDVEFIRMD